MSEESVDYDVVVVGGGPAGLAASIRLRQLARQRGEDLSVCLLEKGATIGAHTLSGAVFDPKSLNKLIPDWADRGAPVSLPVSSERFFWLSEKSRFPLPAPSSLHRGCYVISLGALTRWLAGEAERVGVEIYPGFAATSLLFSQQGGVEGVVSGDKGVDKQGKRRKNYQPGLKIRARQTLLAEGCRGELSGQVIARFGLDGASQPQSYSLGIKELWEVDSAQHRPGLVVHTLGWPLATNHYGGGFVYHQEQNRLAIGLVMGLEYEQANLDLFALFQRFKTHPLHRTLLQSGRRIGFGARTLVEGGVQSLPKLTFPGGMLLGDAGGTMDVGRMKGCHTALYSGQLAAEAAFGLITEGQEERGSEYASALKRSWLWRDLWRSRNLRPGFRWGVAGGGIHGAVDQGVLRGRAPWTLSHREKGLRIDPGPHPCRPATPSLQVDDLVTFDRASSLYLAALSYEEDQPCHIQTTRTTPADNQLRHYCPAGVFSSVMVPGNCLQCKGCDIKDADPQLRWSAPEGGDGPHYLDM
ncbi:MAG: 4Fe-4S dicluster domain-containing protein [Magnetococcales bacterium]|nr:4Fe-4S dicluster domain-containing protein [Magnetococcales bacterium]